MCATVTQLSFLERVETELLGASHASNCPWRTVLHCRWFTLSI